ncbi:hypothetical protein GRI62_02855 [Erythrobacter arachoides]|uniref:Phage shock protein B n=1 Tax=Aurantiacibacter arachoides TaxID=1850444 RepID=A0A844ZYK6_9SPHN|nr:hypothetical protein [Aurantiacibacter arachoides]MXO92544.1 hypothetical protein [Aurantiacibacter arachoides]GGD56340.1 hypothetical protein GCM10011411_15440 [Aurantiacibacter arachoides]
MNFAAAMVLIVMVLALTVLAMQFAENRKDRLRGNPEDGQDRLREERDEARAELADLRERVKVLERIATDPARRTAEEIEALRDK